MSLGLLIQCTLSMLLNDRLLIVNYSFYCHESYNKNKQLERMFFDTTVQPRSCLHHLIKHVGLMVYTIPYTPVTLKAFSEISSYSKQNQKYQPFISYALSKSQTSYILVACV